MELLNCLAQATSTYTRAFFIQEYIMTLPNLPASDLCHFFMAYIWNEPAANVVLER